MAFSPFTAGLFTAGQILTAAQMNIFVRDNIMAGGPVYATEAARTADIPSPYEGQRAYITGSTETTAAGAITSIPTGIQTIYNGAGWVTVTPVGGQTVTSGTTTSTSFTTLTGGGTNPYAELRTGTTALVSLFSYRSNSGANAVYFSFSVSGATTLAAGGTFNSITTTSSTAGQAVIITGLTAGVNRFTLAYSVAAGTGTYQDRFITAQGIA
jgi:hypothetical protein